MNNTPSTLERFGGALIHKFVSEEIVTKTELNQQLDRIVSKYIEHIDRKFDHVDGKFDLVDKQIVALKTDIDKRFEQIDVRDNWIIGLIISASIAIAGIVVKLH